MIVFVRFAIMMIIDCFVLDGISSDQYIHRCELNCCRDHEVGYVKDCPLCVKKEFVRIIDLLILLLIFKRGTITASRIIQNYIVMFSKLRWYKKYTIVLNHCLLIINTTKILLTIQCLFNTSVKM